MVCAVAFLIQKNYIYLHQNKFYYIIVVNYTIVVTKHETRKHNTKQTQKKQGLSWRSNNKSFVCSPNHFNANELHRSLDLQHLNLQSALAYVQLIEVVAAKPIFYICKILDQNVTFCSRHICNSPTC